MLRENPRKRITSSGVEFFTEEEELAQDAIDQAWADGADDRTAALHRETRNQLLADSDWTQANDSPLNNEAKLAWAEHRSALRNITSHANWPNLADEDWPTPPS